MECRDCSDGSSYIGAGVSWVFSGQNLAKNHKWSCYEGSYIEVNGKRITDVKKIMPCIIETLEYANEVEQLARQRIDEIHRSEQEIKEKEDLVNN